MRYYLDEQLDVAIAVQARERGLDVVTARDCGMLNQDDRQHLTFAASQQRCVVTGDLSDFSNLSREFAIADLPHAGVLLVSANLRPSIGRVLGALEEHARQHPDGMTPYEVGFL